MTTPLSLLFAVLLVGATGDPDRTLDPTADPTGERTADPVAGYHNHAAMTQALRSAASASGGLARLVSIGKSLEGRDIWVVEISSPSAGPADERPGLLLVANLEGNQLAGSELALDIVDHLVSSYATDADVKAQLDNAVFYVIPRANPDGAERMFAALQTGQSTNTRSTDDDNDGRTDEDGPQDLNGDGYITVMRVADPTGAYMVDPADARAMKKADPAKRESGVYKVYWEGLDDDGDGYYNEDPTGGVNLNRNYQHEYPYYTVGAGPHMLSELESRAIMDFVIGHRNIAAMVVLGPHDNLVVAPNNKGELAPAKGLLLPTFADASNAEARTVGTFSRPSRGFFGGGGQDQSRTGRPSSGRRPETTVNESDREYFTAVSERYKEIVGVDKLPGVEKPAGALFEYGYYQFGVPSFSTPGWGPMVAAADSAETGDADGEGNGEGEGGSRPGRAGARSGGDADASTDVAMLKWMDGAGVDGFVAWTPFDHPTLGQVEIGGFRPYEHANPPREVLTELAPKHGDFLVALASMFADVRIAKTEVTDHGGGVFRIKAEVENAGYFPTSTAHGVVSRTVRPTMVQLEIEPDALLSGDAKTSFFQKLDGSGNRESFEWLISGSRGDRVTLRVVSQKGGQESAVIELR